MGSTTSVLTGQICPYIDVADPRCAGHLNLGHIRDAFDLCVCDFEHCPVYRQLKNERIARSGRGKP